MPRIELITPIAASPERCFDLARDIDLHLRSMVQSGERAVAGRRTGLIELGEEVTWRARYFGLTHEHTSRITALDRPRHFHDSMIAGRFKRFEHDHFFEPCEGGTIMRDILEFESPFGILGTVVNAIFLTRYLTSLLEARNSVIRHEAERGGQGSR